MRILWGSNSPWAPSGYGVQTALAVSRLQADHQFAIAANYGVDAGMLGYHTPHGEVPIYPQGGAQYSQDIAAPHAADWGAQVIITHYDAWVFDPAQLQYPWVPWYPVDCEDVPESISSRIQHAAMRITQTKHGVDRTARRGLDAEYVPAAFDASVYYPRERRWRDDHHLADRYVVACVAANTGHPGSPSRKSYPQIFEAFKLFLDTRPDAILYVHAQHRGQLDLIQLAHHYGIDKHLYGANSYYLHIGRYSGDDMAEIYSDADVLLSPSMGEGFGVPIVEAQACGTPVITGDWTAMSEITRTGLALPKEDATPYPIVGYGQQYLPRPESIRDALIESTNWTHDPADVAARVQEYEIEHVITEHWQPTLAKLEDRLQAPVAPALNRAARRRQVKLKDKAVA